MDYSNFCSGEIGILIGAIRTVFGIIQIGIPVILMVLMTFDFVKAMASGDEKKRSDLRKVAIQRLIYALVAFLVPFILNLVFNFVGNNFSTVKGATDAQNANANFFSCWSSSSSRANTNNQSNDVMGMCTYIDENGEAVSIQVTRSVCRNNYPNGNFVANQN